MVHFYSFLNSNFKKEKKINKNFSEFKIRYLHKGTGEAIGNLIRKTLFSCIEGYAIEKIFFKNFNEFSYLPGLNKDLTEIILNIKNVCLKLKKYRKIKIKFSLKGPKIFYAKNISNKFCSIINGEKKIFEFKDKKKLKFYFKIGKGIGYNDVRKNYNGNNEILIDSYYCPIRKVYFKIKNKRYYENLYLGIKTNLTISPKKAFKKSLNIIRKTFFFKKKKVLYKKNFLIIKKKLFSKKILNIFMKKNIFFYGDITYKFLRKNFSKLDIKKILKILNK
ncbi:DNA-directed RNA polymerase alpha subunit [Candidatus Vidania fulgoroideae]|uniref:DNA-directed RNA polymerase alpha subunit n=1 Tax=Candidatus Vidania fulgoroideorum TaxID=881286 RepID=A0A346E0Q4_9PROT|nr:DNA-directed RNA polymerase alpha subunit [Candidatus Vidania fulgoroideae]WDI79351.1 hypothetical protein ONB79_00610 [Candidatus Vidania fulgoroideae]WDR79254.1 hypothetical protein ONB65_00905 [Candidatus Vidania fulgoroideae]